MDKKLKILLSGGGTGGHIFPAIAIADEIKKRFPDAEFKSDVSLEIGREGKVVLSKKTSIHCQGYGTSSATGEILIASCISNLYV